MVFYLRSCEVRTEVRFKSLTVGQGDISLQQIILMGPCASHNQDGKRSQLPLVYQVPGSKQKVFTSGLNELQFQLSKVSIVPSPSPDSDLSFSISGIAEIPMQRANKSSQRLEDEQLKPADKTFEIKWQQVNKLELCLSDAQLVQTYLSVHLTQDNKVAVEVVRISLYLIVNGPYHHNIEVPLGKHPRRVIFDAKISHIFEINTRVQQLDLNLNHGFLNSFKLCHFTVKAIRQEEVIADSAQSYSIDPQILCKLQQNTENYFQQQRPNISKLKTIKKTFPQEGQKLTPLSWSNLAQKNSEKKMPEVTFDSSTLQIASYSIQIGIWSENDRRSQYVCQANVPLWKLLDREYIKEKKNREDTQGHIVSLQDRILTIVERVYCHQDVIGTCELQLHILNQKLIEQSKYSSRTEEGVVNLRPSTFTKTINSNSKTIHQIWKLSNQIDKTVKEEAFKSSIEEVQAKIQLILRQIYEILKTTLNQVLYSDANKCEALLNNQQIFISLMTKLSPFTEDAQNSSLSQISWAIIIGFLKRRQFVLQNLSLKGIYETPQSQHIFNKKKDVGLKYQEVLYKLITNALRCYGLYSSNNNMLSHFLSFCYFRVPTFRDYFLEVMDFQNNYAQMESKLIVFQRQIEPKTSFGSSFAQIKGDWKSNFYDQLQQIGKSKDLGRQLLCSFRSKKFFMQLSYKDQTLYNFFSLLFRCLSNDSSQKADKWKYIQGYSKIVAIILTVLKEKEVTKYSPSLIKLSIDLLENEHLLSPMLPLICDQTNVHDVQKVQIALDLMEQYLQAATKKKERQIPTSFNSNYLLKVVRAILEGENCYAINRFLVIIYHFFDQFGTGFKLQISMYLTGKIFFKLFYHWSSEVRYTFYILLLVKVQHISHPRKAQINSHITKILSIVKIFYIIYDKNHTKTHIATQQALYKKMKMKVQQKFKKNKPCKSLSNNKKEYSLENIYKMLDQDIVICPQFFSQQLIKNKSGVDHTPAKNRFIENEQFDLEIPGKSERSFSDKIPPQQILKKSPSFCEMEGEGKKQDFSRKKRRPSVFVQSIVVSPNSKNQLIPKISNELQELSELQEGEIKNIGISTAQFNEVSQQISKYAQTHSGALPTSDYIDIKKNVSAA